MSVALINEWDIRSSTVVLTKVAARGEPATWLRIDRV